MVLSMAMAWDAANWSAYFTPGLGVPVAWKSMSGLVPSGTPVAGTPAGATMGSTGTPADGEPSMTPAAAVGELVGVVRGSTKRPPMRMASTTAVPC